MAGSLRDPGVLAAIQAARRPPPGVAGPFASPADWRDGWIYFLMVDRFNNPSAAPVHQPYDDPGYAGFQGGTFRGVQAQLGYIRDLAPVTLGPVTPLADATVTQSDGTNTIGAVTVPVSLQPMEIQILSC